MSITIHFFLYIYLLYAKKNKQNSIEIMSYFFMKMIKAFHFVFKIKVLFFSASRSQRSFDIRLFYNIIITSASEYFKAQSKKFSE